MKSSLIFVASITALTFLGLSSGIAEAVSAPDQSYVLGNTAFSIPPSGSLAQVVTPTSSGSVSTVEVKLWKTGTPNEGVTVSIRAVSAGAPTGPDLASKVLTNSEIGFANDWISVDFATPAQVTAGTSFAVVLATTNTNNDYNWSGNNAGTYSGGQAFQNPSGTWVALAGWGLNFRSYVSTADLGPTPPPVMQQFGMPASGTCDAAAPIVLNWGGAGSGGWGNSWAQWMNGGAGGAVCTRTLVYSSSLGHWVAS